jgi:AhpD family alkylhydroperoxidase
MAVTALVTDEQATGRVAEIFADIRKTRGTDFINNFWRAIAIDPDLLERTWLELKAVMLTPGEIDPLTKEMIYIGVSVANGCSYCVHSHTAAATAKGMSATMHGELLSVIALAGKTNQLAESLQVPVDDVFMK